MINIIVILLLVFIPIGLYAQQKLVINTPSEPPYHYPDQTGIVDQEIIEVFRRLNIEVAVQWLPMERALVNANAGLEDGDAGRIAGLSANYPNLLMVPEKIMVSEFVAFTKGLDFPTTSWEALRPHNVGLIRGFKIGEANIKNPRSLVQVEDVKQLFLLLDKGRVDVVVMEKVFGSFAVRELNMTGVKVLQPPLARQDMFLYLNKKHAALLPKVTEALKAIKADGTYQRLFQGLDKFTMFK